VETLPDKKINLRPCSCLINLMISWLNELLKIFAKVIHLQIKLNDANNKI